MSNLSEAIGSTVHLLALDTAETTVGFIDTELHFTDGTVEARSATLVRSHNEITTPVNAPSSTGDIIRAGLFEEFDDLKEYRIVDTVFPSDKREFKRRVKERQRRIMGARLYQNVMATLIDDQAGRIGTYIDVEL